jgi:hypothetical protein
MCGFSLRTPKLWSIVLRIRESIIEYLFLYPPGFHVCGTLVDDKFFLEMEQDAPFGLDNRNQQGSICLHIVTTLALTKIFAIDYLLWRQR